MSNFNVRNSDIFTASLLNGNQLLKGLVLPGSEVSDK